MGIEPAIDVTAEQRKTVLALLKKHLPNTTAWVYGSRAKWTSRPQSDLDMVVFATPEQSSQVFALREAFEESNLPFRVDLFVWDDVPERFRKRIEAEYVVLVEKKGWKTVTLGEFAPFTYGKGLPVGKRNPSGVIPVCGSNGIVGYHDSSLTDGPTIIIGRKGTVGSVHYSPIPCWPIDTTFFITGNDPTLIRFKYYALCMIGLEHMNSDSAVPGLNRNDAHARTLLLPEESEQRAIAHILGTLDDKIELNRRMNETLEEMARALFKSWFVDFDPVRAKMEGRDIGLPPDVADLFPDRLVDSELGTIPEGWEVRTLGECFNLTMGQSPPGKTYNDDGDGLPFFQGKTDFSFRYPENRKFCTAPTRIAQPEDTLISVRAPVGDINMVLERCCIGRGLAALRHKSGSSSFTYYSVWAIQREIQQYEHTGTVFGAINKKQFESLKTIEPMPEVAEKFGSIVLSWDKHIRSNTEESRTLAALRDTLLPRLVSGEVRVWAWGRLSIT